MKPRSVEVLAVLLWMGPVVAAQPVRGSPLGPGETYDWSIRAWHSDELLLAVGDSVDVVLLRDRCGADAGHGRKGCWDASTIRIAPRWRVSARGIARVRALPEGSWRFGPGTAGARIYGTNPGAAAVNAILPGGEIVEDSILVIAAPGAVRIVLEPKPETIVPGDTIRFRVTARDAQNRIVAILPLPQGWNVVGPQDSLGFAPVAFYPWETRGKLVPRLGRLTDTLELRFAPRTAP
jgi:hypothetical protein